MDPDQGRLYIGTREYLVSMDMQNVNKEPLIVSISEICRRSCTLYCMVPCYKNVVKNALFLLLLLLFVCLMLIVQCLQVIHRVNTEPAQNFSVSRD